MNDAAQIQEIIMAKSDNGKPTGEAFIFINNYRNAVMIYCAKVRNCSFVTLLTLCINLIVIKHGFRMDIDLRKNYQMVRIQQFQRLRWITHVLFNKNIFHTNNLLILILIIRT